MHRLSAATRSVLRLYAHGCKSKVTLHSARMQVVGWAECGGRPFSSISSSHRTPMPSDTKFKYLSFYKYTELKNPKEVRDKLLRLWDNKKESPRVFGRIYLSKEGINAQMSVSLPYFNSTFHADVLEVIPELSLSKIFSYHEAELSSEESAFSPTTNLRIKVRSSLVVDGLQMKLDMSQTGKPLSPQEWHNALSAPSSPGEKPARIFDCRNEFENEVGHFQGATPLPTQRFIETFDAMQELLQGSSQDDNIYIYCTGGIRCEKVGAWLTQVKKYKNVFRLEGGINAYAKQVVAEGKQPSIFKGTNFVFDERSLKSHHRLTSDVLTGCYYCGTPMDVHSNCANPRCDVLILQCASCAAKMNHACSTECAEVVIKGTKGEAWDGTPRPGAPPQMQYERRYSGPRAPLQCGGKIVRNLSTMVNKVDSRPTKEVLEEYAERKSTQQSLHLARVFEYTYLRYPAAARMMIGPLCASFLQYIIKVSGAVRVLELGCFTGYSALAMAEALPAGGSIITCDQDKAAAEVAKSNFASHPDGYKVSIHVGDALEALEAFEKTQVPAFDIVFIDADKSRYSQYFERLVAGPVLRSGGTIIVDNVLWKGSAPSDDSNQDWRSNALAQFNDYVASDPRVEVVVLPIREGLSLIRKL